MGAPAPQRAHGHMTLWPSGQGVGPLSRWGLPAWAQIPQVSLFARACAPIAFPALNPRATLRDARARIFSSDHAAPLFLFSTTRLGASKLRVGRHCRLPPFDQRCGHLAANPILTPRATLVRGGSSVSRLEATGARGLYGCSAVPPHRYVFDPHASLSPSLSLPLHLGGR